MINAGQMFDHSTLRWIREGLDDTLLTVRLALERFVDDEDALQAISECAEALHRISGTLKVAQVYGAAMLADEMERVARAIADGKVAKPQEVAESLMLGVVQLPLYLEKVESGAPDVPLALMPLLNDLRAGRDAPLVSETALFAPKLEELIAAEPVTPGSGNMLLGDTIKALRSKYHRGLLLWFRDIDPKRGLAQVREVLESINAQAGTKRIRRLMEAAEALSISLMHEGGDVAAAVKPLFGRIDRLLKQILDGGEEAAAQQFPMELLRNLLYYVAHSDSSDPVVRGVQQTVDAANAIELAGDSGPIVGSSRELFRAVGEALVEDLRVIKDEFDLYTRGDRKDFDRLSEILRLFHRVGDTLGMIGRGELHAQVSSRCDALHELLERGESPDDEELMLAAADILAVESAVQGMPNETVAGQAEVAQDMLAGEMRGHVEALIKEAFVEFSHTKSIIDDYLRQPEDRARLAEIMALLHKLAGVMRMAELDAVADLLAGLAPYLQALDDMRVPLPTLREKEAFADVLSSAEFYLESLLNGGASLDAILAYAQRGLEYLQGQLLHTGGGNVAAGLEMAAEEGAESSVAAAEIALPESGVSDTSHDEQPLAVSVVEEAGAVDESEPMASFEDAEVTVIEVDSAQAVAETPISPLDDIDPEIFEVFMEEAEEELGVIVSQYPLWREDHSNQQALQAFRRSFHTLKGSGRLVGASVIGEFAWAIENLLNRVMDGTTPTDEKLLALMDKAIEALPLLIAAQAKGTAVPVNLGSLEQQAFALADTRRRVAGESGLAPEMDDHQAGGVELDISPEPEGVDVEPIISPALDVVAASEQVAEAESAPLSDLSEELEVEVLSIEEPESAPLTELSEELEVEDLSTEEPEEITNEEPVLEAMDVSEPEPVDEVPEPEIELDPELLEIFSAESLVHLATVKDFIDQCRDRVSGHELTDALSRAVHTLRGSARTAGVTPMAELSNLLEPYLIALREHGQRTDAGLLDLLDRYHGKLHEILGVINVPGIAVPDTQALLNEISERMDLLEESIREAELAALEGDTSEVLDSSMMVSSEEVGEFGLASADGSSTVDGDSEYESILSFDAPAESAEREELDAALPASFSMEDESILRVDEVSEDIFVQESALPTSAETISRNTEMLDPELLEIFLEEAVELGEQLESAFSDWEDALTSTASLNSLQRSLHTLKGGARLAGITPLGDLSHAMESLFEAMVEGLLSPDEELRELARRGLDQLGSSIDQLQRRVEISDCSSLVHQMERAARGESWADVMAQAGSSAQEQNELEGDVDLQLDTDYLEVQEGAESEVTEGDDQGVDTLAADSSLFTDSQLLNDSEWQSESVAFSSSSVIPFPSREQKAASETADETVIKRERPPPLQPEEERGTVGAEMVRVRSELLDHLVNNAGEVSIYRARLEQQNTILDHNLDELTNTVNRLHDQLRKLELETEAQILSRHEREQEVQQYEDFDPLEMDRYSMIQQLSRALSETVNDLTELGDTMHDLSRDTETLLVQQARVNNDLQDGLLRTRMVPFLSQVSRLQRVVRQTAQTIHKVAALRVEGGEGEMDRSILNRMLGPLEHLLRNAVAHGIELPEERRKAGKPVEGSIELSLAREGADVVITIRDDGRGLDLERIRARAVERGLMFADADMDERDLYQLVLERGFSTVDDVSQVAGRGVGMDAVVSEVKQLGGSLDIDSVPGRGASFTIRLPFTLAISEALLVQLGEDVFAVPHGSVDGIIRGSYQELMDCYRGETEAISYAGQEYGVRYLGTMMRLGVPKVEEGKKWFPLLLVHAGEHRLAIHVDELLGNRQIVVKSIGTQLSSVRWYTGGTILADGQVALILDINALVRMDSAHHHRLQAASAETAGAQEVQGVKVLVVDDSITVRKVTSRLLERHHMEVNTAKDGVDAVAVLQEYRPDVILLDIEMPRMDGFELARHLRNSRDLRDIPIIMITSRSGEKHRERAMSLGVKRYLGKPYQETDLLENIYSVLGEKVDD